MLVWVESSVRREFQLAASVVSVQQLEFTLTRVACRDPADDVSPETMQIVTVSLSTFSCIPKVSRSPPRKTAGQGSQGAPRSDLCPVSEAEEHTLIPLAISDACERKNSPREIF